MVELTKYLISAISTKKVDGTKTRKRDGSRPAEAEGICGTFRTKMRNFQEFFFNKKKFSAN